MVGKRIVKEACDALNKNFASRLLSRIIELQTRLHNHRKGNTNIETYIQTLRNISDELNATRSVIQDQDLTFSLLRGFGQII